MPNSLTTTKRLKVRGREPHTMNVHTTSKRISHCLLERDENQSS